MQSLMLFLVVILQWRSDFLGSIDSVAIEIGSIKSRMDCAFIIWIQINKFSA